MISIKEIRKSHLDSMKIYTCHTYAFHTAEWALFSWDMLLAMLSLLKQNPFKLIGRWLKCCHDALAKMSTYIVFFLPYKNKQHQFIFHNYHFKANPPRPLSTLTPTHGIKDNYCRHHIKLQLLVCLFVLLYDLKTAVFHPGKVPSHLLPSLCPPLWAYTHTHLLPVKRRERTGSDSLMD